MVLKFPSNPRDGQIWPPRGANRFRYIRGSGWTPEISGVLDEFRMLSEVKWLWVKHGTLGDGQPLTGVSGSGVEFDQETGVFSASTNTALPTPIAFDTLALTAGGINASASASNSTVATTLFAGTQPVGLAADVAGGIGTGDRIYVADMGYWGMHGVYTVEDVGENGVRPWRLKLVPELFPLDRMRNPYMVKTKKNYTSPGFVSGMTVVHEHFWDGSFTPNFQFMWSSDSIGVEPVARENEVIGSYNCISIGGTLSGSSNCVSSHPANVLVGCWETHVSNLLGVVVGVRGNGAMRGFTEVKRNDDITGTSYTLVAHDMSRHLVTTNGSAVTITLPTNETAASWIKGACLKITQGGAGGITISPAGGVTALGGLTTAGVGETITLLYRGSDNWIAVS